MIQAWQGESDWCARDADCIVQASKRVSHRRIARCCDAASAKNHRLGAKQSKDTS
jgi:hypothetical protein